MTKLSNADPFENPIIEFDFSTELDAVDSVTVSVSVAKGVDTSVALVLDGAVQIVGARVSQRITGGVIGVDYKLRCEAVRGTTRRVISGVLPVRRA